MIHIFSSSKVNFGLRNCLDLNLFIFLNIIGKSPVKNKDLRIFQQDKIG